MVDLEDLSARPGTAALPCDRAIFTSLPSPTGEGYRLVAWSGGVRPEERVELTRRAPSHGSLCSETAGSRALLQFRLQATGRVAWGLVRVSGAEHTRRGGGRVWTDFFLCPAPEAEREGLHPHHLRTALAANPAPKPPLGSSPLATVDVGHGDAGEPAARDARGIAAAAALASILVEGRAVVVGVGPATVDVFEDAMRMIPASLRGRLEACAGLRFSTARGVKASIVERIEPDVLRATRGQGVDCIDLVAKPAAAGGALAPWFALVQRWWNEQRAAEAIEIADRLSGGWSEAEILQVASVCEAIDRAEKGPGALDALLQRNTAA